MKNNWNPSQNWITNNEWSRYQVTSKKEFQWRITRKHLQITKLIKNTYIFIDLSITKLIIWYFINYNMQKLWFIFINFLSYEPWAHNICFIQHNIVNLSFHYRWYRVKDFSSLFNSTALVAPSLYSIILPFISFLLPCI